MRLTLVTHLSNFFVFSPFFIPLGILSVAVHIGNSDHVALFIYKDSKQLLDTISESKKINGVVRVLLSEEVYIKMNESKLNMLNNN
ncbi:hypothetical protein BH18THE1_BH18THE1_08250 [soil metagenome]